jgi:hypothetical protein
MHPDMDVFVIKRAMSVPVLQKRDFNGLGYAIYFLWLNFFIKWLMF